jgi:hypothetical protein
MPVSEPLLNESGVRELAIAVLQQAAADLRGTNAIKQRRAAAFVRRTKDFSFWCQAAGLDATAAREYLAIREAA